MKLIKLVSFLIVFMIIVFFTRSETKESDSKHQDKETEDFVVGDTKKEGGVNIKTQVPSKQEISKKELGQKVERKKDEENPEIVDDITNNQKNKEEVGLITFTDKKVGNGLKLKEGDIIEPKIVVKTTFGFKVRESPPNKAYVIDAEMLQKYKITGMRFGGVREIRMPAEIHNVYFNNSYKYPLVFTVEIPFSNGKFDQNESRESTNDFE